MENFNLKLNICGFVHTVRKMKSKSGEMIDVIILPIDANHVFKGEKGMYVDITAIAVANPKFDDTHILKQSLPKEVYEKLSDEDKKKTPIFGNMAPWKKNAGEAPANIDSGSDDDDLPF